MEINSRQQCYEILGISTSSDENDIKRAYKRLARKYHPDLHMNESKEMQEKYKLKFQEITKAYTILLNKDDVAILNMKVDIPSYEEILKTGAFGEFITDYDNFKYPPDKSNINCIDNLINDITESRS